MNKPLLRMRTKNFDDLYLKIDQKWSGHGLTSLTGSYGPDYCYSIITDPSIICVHATFRGWSVYPES